MKAFKKRSLKEKFLEKNIYIGLTNLNNGFDSKSIKYFSKKDFQRILTRVEKFGLGIYGIEPFENGKYFDCKVYEEYSEDPTDKNWYHRAFNEFVEKNEGCTSTQVLQYSASYFIPYSLLRSM